MTIPVAAPIYFANMPASVPMAPAAPPVVAQPPMARQNARIGAKIKAAVFVAVFAVALLSPLGQRVVRYVCGDVLPEGVADLPFFIKSTLASWLAVTVAAVIFMREV